MPFAFVAFVWNFFEKCLQFVRPLQSRLDFHINNRVRIVFRIGANPVTLTPRSRVSKRPATLQFVSNASIEVILMTSFNPERSPSFRKKIVDKLCDRTMNLLHHRSEIITHAQVAQRVVMIIHQ